MTYDIVKLSDDEWNNEVMLAVSMEHFQENPECQFVQVYEHGGWMLGFRRDETVWDTANDTARLTDPYPQPDSFSGVYVDRNEVIRGRMTSECGC